jgi:hypothetical protein
MLMWRWFGLPGREDIGVEKGDEHMSSFDFLELRRWASSDGTPSLEGLQGDGTTRPLKFAALKETPLWWHWARLRLSFRCRRALQAVLILDVE